MTVLLFNDVYGLFIFYGDVILLSIVGLDGILVGLYNFDIDYVPFYFYYFTILSEAFRIMLNLSSTSLYITSSF
jgi:hypothetical protein